MTGRTGGTGGTGGMMLILVVMVVMGVLAMDPTLLMRTHTDPTRMRGILDGSASFAVGTGFMRGGETEFTVMAWIRFPWGNVGSPMGSYTSFWSVDPARATREGGAELPAVLEVTNFTGNAGGTFADPQYACPATIADKWQYGCYAVNVETATPLTLTIAGTEKNIPASNGVVQAFNVQGTAADYSWSVSGSGAYRFGFAVNPLVEFHGLTAQHTRYDYGGDHAGRLYMAEITNEWILCVSRVRLDGAGLAMENQCALSWDAEWWEGSEKTNVVVRTEFARDARVSILACHIARIDGHCDLDTYGFKILGRWLTDDEVRNVRDLDVFEMQRRGIQRRRQK